MKLFQIYFYVPNTHLEIVKEAMFSAGAGRVGNYSKCAWQVLGEGQFLPEEGSAAYIGEIGKVEAVPEYKVEMVCSEDKLDAVIAALKGAHAYETPAYGVTVISEQG